MSANKDNVSLIGIR